MRQQGGSPRRVGQRDLQPHHHHPRAVRPARRWPRQHLTRTTNKEVSAGQDWTGQPQCSAQLGCKGCTAIHGYARCPAGRGPHSARATSSAMRCCCSPARGTPRGALPAVPPLTSHFARSRLRGDWAARRHGPDTAQRHDEHLVARGPDGVLCHVLGDRGRGAALRPPWTRRARARARADVAVLRAAGGTALASAEALRARAPLGPASASSPRLGPNSTA